MTGKLVNTATRCVDWQEPQRVESVWFPTAGTLRCSGPGQAQAGKQTLDLEPSCVLPACKWSCMRNVACLGPYGKVSMATRVLISESHTYGLERECLDSPQYEAWLAQIWFSRSRVWDQVACRGCVGSEQGSGGSRREILGCNAASTEASSEPTGSSEAETALPNGLTLRQGVL